MEKTVKVKIVGKCSTTALIKSGFNSNMKGFGVCFHAYSSTMKARVLEAMAINPELKIELSIVEGEPREGEWME